MASPFQADRLAGFVVRLFAWYLVLTAPWPGLSDRYGDAVRACGNALFGTFGTVGVVRFKAAADLGPSHDTGILFGPKRNPNAWLANASVRRMSYLPTAVTAALVLASPLPWRRRMVALAWGLAFVHLFVLVRLSVTIYYYFVSVSIIELTPYRSSALRLAYEALSESLVPSFVGPAVIWLLVAFRIEDWSPMVPRVRSASPKAPLLRHPTNRESPPRKPFHEPRPAVGRSAKPHRVHG